MTAGGVIVWVPVAYTTAEVSPVLVKEMLNNAVDAALELFVESGWNYAQPREIRIEICPDGRRNQ